jgi:hypothetical protein
MPDGIPIKKDVTGTHLGRVTTDKLGLYGVTPVVQATGASQAAVTQTGVAVATTAATNSSPYGYAEAQANAIVANLNAATVDIAALIVLVNKLRTDLVALGAIKGAA